MKKRTLLSIFMLLILALACGFPSAPTSTSPLTSSPYADHILVSLTEPLDGDAYPISAGLSIRGEAISDGSIARMELWADGKLYEEYSAPEDGLGLLVHYWTWSPATLGWHTLMIRAYNDQNQSAFSSVVNVEGIPDTGYVVIAQAEDGDTVASIAERFNVSTDELLTENPNLAIASSLQRGQEVFVHVGAPAISSVPSAGAKVWMKLNEFSANKGSPPPAAPSAPSLTVTGQGCNATLAISDSSDSEQGFNIYRLNPGAMGFSKLASLSAHEGTEALTHQDSNLYGMYHYYVAAFDESGEAASNLVSLDIVDANCAGTPTTIDDLASIPSGVEEYYLYISLNNGTWRRFPADDFTYLKKSQGLDFGAVAASLAPNMVGDIAMRGEVWGMVNGAAIMLGTFEKSIKPNQAPVKFEPASFQYLFATKLEARGIYDVSKGKYPWLVEKGFGYGAETFRFGTDVDASYGIWQVSSVPFEPGVSFNPACLLLSGKANGVGTPDVPFVFGIDFSALKPTIESVQLSPFENMLDQTPAFFSPYSPEKFDASPQQTVQAPNWGAGAFSVDGAAPEFASFDPCAQNMSAEGVVTYYARLIPMNNGQAAGGASNSVILKYDPNGQIKITIPVPPAMPQGVYYDVEILNFTGAHVPDLLYKDCVEIVEDNNPMTSYKPGDKVCPETFSGGNKNDLLGAVEDAFNFISGLYNKLSDWVTDLVDKLNPLCIQAKLASSAVQVGEKEVKDACHYIAVAVVTAAKTYVGLPPSLPNFDQLTELGKENLVDMAAQELEAQGIPCPEDCKNVIRKGLDYSLEQAKQNMSNSSCKSKEEAHANGHEPLCLPPGVTSRPDSRGQPAPAVLEVKVTRLPNASGPDFPEPKSCWASASVYAKNNVVDSYTSEAGFHWSGGAIEGSLLSGSAAFPNLQPGESTTFPILLEPSSFWLEGHQQFVKKGWEPEHFDDWHILYQGAMATVDAGGGCNFELPEGKGYSPASISKDQIQVGPLGEAWKQTCHPYNCP